MPTVKLHGNSSSSNSFNFAIDVDAPSSPADSLCCSVYLEENCSSRLGPYDLQECRSKMSNGASPSPLVVIPKKKKHDVKGQSQLNKCLNEKRRREQENIYIEELAELISASFADMSSLSVKPDKCAILQETVKHVLRAGTHRVISTDQVDNSLISTEAAVQQGEVSSSKPAKISNTELAPLLLSALDGFLFVVNPDGQIEFVTENIEIFLNYNKEELIGKSVYNIIHHGDHARFGNLLNKPLLIYNTSILSPGSNRPTSPLMDQSPSGSKGNNWNQKFTTKFNCRLLIKPPSDQNQSVEEKQTRVCQYETLQISSTKINTGMVSDEETNQNLLCIARRVPYNEKHLSSPLEQFTLKLDKNGKIIALDNKDVSDIYAQHINKDCLVGRMLHDLCHKNDVHKIVNHLKETREVGLSTSPNYKLHLHEDMYVNVQTKSKYFKSNDNRDVHFIMAAHSIIGDVDVLSMIENNHNASQTTDDHLTTDLSESDSLPLMTGSESSQPILNIQSESKLSSSEYNNMVATNDLNFTNFRIFPNTTYGDKLQENKWSVHSPGSVEPPSKITPAPSPCIVSSNPQTPMPQAQYNSFPFSPLIPSPKDSFECSSNVDRLESARLRTLLMTSKRTDVSNDENNITNKHNILKGLLDPDEMVTQNADELLIHDTSSPSNVRQASHNSTLNDANNHSNNNMLLKLLNDNSEDENYEVPTGFKKQNVLLQQLLNADNIKQHNFIEQNDQVSNEDLLLNSMGFRIISPASPENIHGRKRNSISFDDENDRPPSKRTHSGTGPSVLESLSSPSCSQSQVTNSKLRERNKMLASLLAKDLPPTNIPSIPASVISATPQDKLVTIMKQPQQSAVGNWNANNNGQHSMNLPSQSIQQNQRISLPKSDNNLHLNHVLDQPSGQSQMRLVTSTASSQLNNITESNSNPLTFNSDPELSELLEEVMDIMNVNSDNSTLLNLFNVIETANVPNTLGQNTINQTSFNLLMNEKMAVNAIQKSLMQVESSVKSPSQVNYGSPTNSSNLRVQNQFNPPPAYQPQKTVGFGSQQQSKLAGIPLYPKNVHTPPLQQQQVMLQHQQKQMLIQQQQKQRLLKQQEGQKIMLVTTNATSPDPNIALQTIDSMNTGPPPNVVLQRSLSVPDSQSQLSPVYAPSSSQVINSSQMSPLLNRLPIYSTQSPQSFSMLNYGTTTQTQTTSQAQVTTPRMTPSTQYQNSISPCVSQQQQTQSIYISQTQPGVWTQQKMTLHQHQNSVLSTQLNVAGGFHRQNFINQQQGHMVSTPVLTSPVSYSSEISPNTNCQPQQQGFRLPRNVNMTISNSQILGGNNGVTEFTRNELRTLVGVRSQQQGSTRLSSQLLPVQNITPTDLDSLGLNFDMSPTGGNESPKWSGLTSDLGSSSSPQPQGMPRNPTDDSINSANSTTNVGETDQKSSLLQKLLSE